MSTGISLLAPFFRAAFSLNRDPPAFRSLEPTLLERRGQAIAVTRLTLGN